MSDTYMEIKQELQLMRVELQERLAKETIYGHDVEFGEELFSMKKEDVRKKILLHDMKEDLKDVERALFKMEVGMYGVCEETGTLLSLKQLKMMPTARTVHEFLYKKTKTF
ncbi:molecular chaperone DnaK [Bacillus manliponensis]|uniref:Molecular chaperone DnaK n=1 Tax=Bacillus manliponensis TaxID=574376 RepID=A0A073K0S0_9BACI|nr:molecular chaperone DnaK [Bacillus manliponensis]KEK20889.1 molecular chaperone DnaK [Bacillus manliponensis]